jgi:hypothetical protein
MDDGVLHVAEMPTRMARYASDTLEFYRRTVLDGLNMGCLVPTIPTGRSRPKGCMLTVKNTDRLSFEWANGCKRALREWQRGG